MSTNPNHPVERPAKSLSGFLQLDESSTPAHTTPFCEEVKGLAVREITDDDLFVHLFGKVTLD